MSTYHISYYHYLKHVTIVLFKYMSPKGWILLTLGHVYSLCQVWGIHFITNSHHREISDTTWIDDLQEVRRNKHCSTHFTTQNTHQHEQRTKHGNIWNKTSQRSWGKYSPQHIYYKNATIIGNISQSAFQLHPLLYRCHMMCPRHLKLSECLP